MIKDIFCVGRNYHAHAQELGNKVELQPVIFCKPRSSLVMGDTLALPHCARRVHFETELVIRISRTCFQVDAHAAAQAFDAIAIGLDLTDRALQNDLKSRGLPWTLAKGFKNAAYVSKFFDRASHSDSYHFSMTLNGETRQCANSSQMIFNFAEVISFLSHYVELNAGDIIFTGTPAGVGPLARGDVIALYLNDVLASQVTII